MKYALVTGASRGIGRAVSLQLAQRGFCVIINYLSNEKCARELLDEIVQQGGQAELLPFDVSSPEAIEAAIDQWEGAHPDEYISALVNNAGIRRDNVMFMMPAEDWHKVLDTTLDGFFYITRRLLKHMMPRKRGGRIVNISSLSGLKGMPGQVNYSAAKAALIGATKALAQEVAPRKITVNAVAPGFIETEMLDAIPEDKTYNDYLNPDSLTVVKGAKIEPALANAAPGEQFQFVRDGYYCKDTKNPDTFNRIVGLKDSFPAKK